MKYSLISLSLVFMAEDNKWSPEALFVMVILDNVNLLVVI